MFSPQANHEAVIQQKEQEQDQLQAESTAKLEAWTKAKSELETTRKVPTTETNNNFYVVDN